MTTAECALRDPGSYSGGNGGQCVEVARNMPGVVAVRDSKDPAGPKLAFTPAQWAASTARVKAAQFELS